MQPLEKKPNQTPTFNKHFVSLQIPDGYSLIIRPYHQFWTRQRQKVKKWGKKKSQAFGTRSFSLTRNSMNSFHIDQ